MIHTTVSCSSLVLLTTLLLPVAGNTQAANQAVFPDLLEFAGKVSACEPATAEQPHPLMPSFTIEHEVMGMSGNMCEYSQTMPGDMKMNCAFDDELRIAFADEIEKMATTGEMSGSTSSQPAWMTACEIETGVSASAATQ